MADPHPPKISDLGHGNIAVAVPIAIRFIRSD